MSDPNTDRAMARPYLSCARCGAILAPEDRYCGACGIGVSGLEVRRTEIPVSPQLGHPRVELHNPGRVPLHISLPDPTALGARVPDWLHIPAALLNKVHTVPPGAGLELALEIRPDVLLERQEEAKEATLFDLRLLCDRNLDDQILDIRLLLVGFASVTPPIVEFPCLPEDLGEPIPLPFKVYNGGGRPLKVVRIEALPAGEVPSVGESLEAGPFLTPPELTQPLVVPPGESLPLELVLQTEGLVKLSPDGPGVGSLAIRIRCHHPEDSGMSPSEGLLLACFARPPRLELDAPVPVQRVVQATPFAATFRNTGAIPVVVTGTRSEASWIRLEAFEPTRVPAGGELTIRYRVDPDRRQGEELSASRLRAPILLETDLPLPTPASFDVQVEVEEVEELPGVLGIDFGNSNSAVALYDDRSQHSRCFQLEWPPRPGPTMPSLIFFDAQGGASSFKFGRQAQSRAAMDPGNLVRSLKRVLTAAPDRVWHFTREDLSQRVRTFESHTSLDLACRLVAELLERAGRAYAELPAMDRPTRATRVRFKRAVFTHPVKMTDAMLETLYQAAKASGVEGGAQSAQEFRDSSMLDEASAAIVHYLMWSGEQGLPQATQDSERILCFDIGGGSTDITLVEATNRNYADETRPLSVRICQSTGDNQFGGDDLDLRVVRHLLQLAQARDPALRVAQVEEAVVNPDFRRIRELLARGAGPGENVDEAARGVLRGAFTVLEEAEQAKIKLGDQEVYPVRLPPDFPREKGTPPPVAQLELELTRAEVEGLIRSATQRVLPLLDQALQGARWTWDSVDTLLFTGQTARSKVVREVVLERALSGRSPGVPPMRVVDPEGSGGPVFDPKGCVSRGAAHFGCSAGTLRIEHNKSLPFTLTRKLGPWQRAIPGLEVGASLPARGTIRALASALTLTLFVNDRPYARVEARNLTPDTDVAIVVESEDVLWLEHGSGEGLSRVGFVLESG